MVEIYRENYVGNFIKDVISTLRNEKFNEIVWVGFHIWMKYAAKAIWQMKWKMNMAITNSDSRWGQEVCNDDSGNNLTFVPFEAAKKTGNDAVYIIAGRQTSSMKEQLVSFGISNIRILIFDTAKGYLDDANRTLEEKYLCGLKQLSHKESQEALFEIMKVFRNFCDTNNLRYFLAGGTLLGAVRHQGFIPWDNDVDLYMPIQDYLKLEAIFPEGRYSLLSQRNSPLLLTGAPKIVDTKYLSFLQEDARITPLSIDIVLYGRFPNERKEMIKEKEKWENFWEKIKESYFLCGSDSLKYQKELYDKYIEWSRCDANIIGEIRDNRVEVEEKLFSTSINLIFEGEEFAAPVGWEKILRQVYKNDLRLPPIDQRVGYKIKNYVKL